MIFGYTPIQVAMTIICIAFIVVIANETYRFIKKLKG